MGHWSILGRANTPAAPVVVVGPRANRVAILARCKSVIPTKWRHHQSLVQSTRRKTANRWVILVCTHKNRMDGLLNQKHRDQSTDRNTTTTTSINNNQKDKMLTTMNHCPSSTGRVGRSWLTFGEDSYSPGFMMEVYMIMYDDDDDRPRFVGSRLCSITTTQTIPFRSALSISTFMYPPLVFFQTIHP